MAEETIACVKRVTPKSDFDKIRKEHLAAKKLFEDPDFPAVNKSLFHSKEPENEIVWMRPHEILKKQKVHKQPIFVHDYASRFDLKQGNVLGDCWFLASAASVSEIVNAFEWLVPMDQNFNKDCWYAGMFRFRFFQYGEWIEVYVDDRIPMNTDGTYAYTHSSDPTVFWGCLLEKAYAKLNRSYEAMNGGTNEEALTDFTGGLVEIYANHEVANLRRLLKKSFAKNTIVAAAIYGDLANPVLKNGLVVGHAYSVTGFGEVVKKDVDKKEFLVRVRNPWGTKTEWNGTWSDNSTEWSTLTDESREALELTKAGDGEYWMSVADFKWQYDSITLCSYEPDEVTADSEKHWKVTVYHNAWKTGETDGGLPTSKEAFDKNKQYLIKVEDKDEDGVASVIIQLTQKYRRIMHLATYVIGFTLIKRPPGTKIPIPYELIEGEENEKKWFVGAQYGGSREVSKRFDLEPGEYVVMPTTKDPGEAAEYMLRIFSEADLDASEVK